MTNILQQAFDEATKLPAEEQDQLGVWLLAELRTEQRWERLWAESGALLEELADEGLAELQAGDTLPLDPHSL